MEMKISFYENLLSTHWKQKNGWIILEDNLKNNELVVVDGAQLLLSEEFKYQIKNENED